MGRSTKDRTVIVLSQGISEGELWPGQAQIQHLILLVSFHLVEL